jgi:FtsP/CotA-like multicopper oxidase with cupredoxin domain
MNSRSSRRNFLANAGILSAAGIIGPSLRLPLGAASHFADETAAEYTVRIRASAVDIGNKHIVSAVTYNDQFPGPLLRFKEGQPVAVEIHNEEGSPSVPAHGMRRMKRKPAGRGVNITRTTGPGRICTQDNTAVRSDPCTSNENTTRESTTAKYFSF